MKLIFILFALLNILYAKTNIVVSILPQQTFVEKIGGDKIKVTTMVKPGSDPHAYEPKPSQMKNISNADIYFSIGLEFENVWLKKFAAQNKNMKFIEMAKDIYETLVKFDSSNKEYYKTNYTYFIKEINDTTKNIKEILSKLPKNSKFMVFHPSWGYFAKEYGLIQLPIEVEGKEPKPKMLQKIIDEAKEQNVKAIFTQQEFSDKSAKAIANELKIKVIKETPLAKDWSQNLIKMAKAIANN